MSNFRMAAIDMATIGAALALLTTGALADPSARAGKTRTPASPSDDGYLVPYVTGPGGQKQSVMDIPGSVTVIPRKVIDDQQATTIGEVLRNSAGVTVGR